jgi:hypothetical protein
MSYLLPLLLQLWSAVPRGGMRQEAKRSSVGYID